LADLGFDRPVPHMDEHRHAIDVGQGLARKPSRCHPGGDHDNRILVLDHGVRRGRGKLLRLPYTGCGDSMKQLVSAHARAIRGPESLRRAIIWTVGNSTKPPARFWARRSSSSV